MVFAAVLYSRWPGWRTLMLWFGLWHELLHADIERTTFYLAQGLGAVLLCRGVVAIYALRAGGSREAISLGSLWSAQVVMCLMMVFRLGLMDHQVVLVYASWAAVSLWLAGAFFRSASADS